MSGIRKWTVASLLQSMLCALGLALPLAAHADHVTDLMDRGCWKDARAAVAALKPGDGRTLYLQSRVQLAMAQAELALRAKDESKAESFYLKALESDPSDYSIRMALSRFYGSDTRKRWDLVEKHARAALASDPGRSGAYSVLAAVFVHGKRWDELDSDFADAARQVPGNLSPQYQAARLLLVEHGDSTRAERYLRQYLSTEPEAGAPKLGAAHWRLGQALERQGKKAEALAEVEMAVKMAPELDEAKKDLKRMKRG